MPLENVLIYRGAVRDQRDKSKWHTEQGPVSVTGPKFINWQRGTGGGKAIDLVMHLADIDFRATEGLGDPRYVWEVNRHHHLVTLARAYALSGDQRYAERIWRDLLERGLIAAPEQAARAEQ